MTNEQEYRWLHTEEAIDAIVKTHVEGIIEYTESQTDLVTLYCVDPDMSPSM